MTLNRKYLDVSDDLLGFVQGTDFVHVECLASEEEVALAVEDEDKNMPILKSDDWRRDVGLCKVCHLNPDDVP